MIFAQNHSNRQGLPPSGIIMTIFKQFYFRLWLRQHSTTMEAENNEQYEEQDEEYVDENIPEEEVDVNNADDQCVEENDVEELPEEDEETGT